MKSTITTATLCLSIGFATAWFFLKDDQTSPAAPTSAEEPQNKPTAKTPAKPAPQPLLTEKEALANKSSFSFGPMTMSDGDQMDPKMLEMMKEAQKRQANMIKNRFAGKFDAQIMNLVKELGLTSEQEAELRAHFDKQLEIIESGNPMGGNLDNLGELASAIRGDKLVESMSDILTEDQLQNLEELQERKKQNQTQSHALRELAKVQQNLDLTEDQKDQMYEVLMKEADEKITSKTDADVVSDAMMSGLGVQIDREALGLDGLMNIQHNPDEPMTQEQLAQAMEESRQKRIDKKVDRFSSILTEQQQQQYRKTIESNNRGILRMMGQ